MDELFREVILDHYRNPRNRSLVSGSDVRAEGQNPFCGDEVAVQLKLQDRHVGEVGVQGRGCSISQASASMMGELLKGKSLEEVRRLAGLFRGMLRGVDPAPAQLEELGELEALRGVRQYPIRIKCALLAWAALEEGLERYEKAKKRNS
ncbi:MAG: SUF system NifU family Fe-S cluster assembly protein [Chloroflexi bacterium]|nr:SUF system NifU family Fe-S cluster assembly protein [Chloroflexota bacterium]